MLFFIFFILSFLIFNRLIRELTSAFTLASPMSALSFSINSSSVSSSTGSGESSVSNSLSSFDSIVLLTRCPLKDWLAWASVFRDLSPSVGFLFIPLIVRCENLESLIGKETLRNRATHSVELSPYTSFLRHRVWTATFCSSITTWLSLKRSAVSKHYTPMDFIFLAPSPFTDARVGLEPTPEEHRPQLSHWDLPRISSLLSPVLCLFKCDSLVWKDYQPYIRMENPSVSTIGKVDNWIILASTSSLGACPIALCRSI